MSVIINTEATFLRNCFTVVLCVPPTRVEPKNQGFTIFSIT